MEKKVLEGSRYQDRSMGLSCHDSPWRETYADPLVSAAGRTAAEDMAEGAPEAGLTRRGAGGAAA